MAKTREASKSLKMPEIISKVGSPYGSAVEEQAKDIFDSGYEIEVITGLDIGQVYPLERKEVTLGRGEIPGETRDGFLMFQDPSVSKVHAVLKWEEEVGKYVIFHHSENTPTLVNGRKVKKSLLSNDYTISMGDLTFKVFSVEEKRRQESAAIWEKFKSGEQRGEIVLDTGYKLVVVEGPDKGSSFDLDKNLMIIGRRRSAGDIRDTYGILLTDPSLSEELALLVWSERDKRFCIYQSENSPVPLQLFRVVETTGGACLVGRNFQNSLEDKDSITAGNTVMVIHRLTEDETPEAKVDIQRKPEPEELKDESNGARTAYGTFKVDYVFEIIEGPDTGHKISMLSEEMTEGKIITFGSPGEVRQNDIELEDVLLAHIQGYLEFSDNNLYLINESGTDIQVNTYVVGENEKIVLNGGDRIKIGNTILAFTDNRVLSALRHYNLSMIAGITQDQARKFPITKTSLYIGRGSACDVRVHDPEVSRLHAVLSFKGSRFHLEHKSKVNPTFVNGISLKKGQDRIIFPGDKIYLSGKSILQLMKTK